MSHTSLPSSTQFVHIALFAFRVSFLKSPLASSEFWAFFLSSFHSAFYHGFDLPTIVASLSHFLRVVGIVSPIDLWGVVSGPLILPRVVFRSSSSPHTLSIAIKSPSASLAGVPFSKSTESTLVTTIPSPLLAALLFVVLFWTSAVHV